MDITPSGIERSTTHRAVGWIRKLSGCLAVSVCGAVQAAQVVIDGPSGSGLFGSEVVLLPNGNIVVADPGFDAPGPVEDVGAVHLLRPDGHLISSVRGGAAGDRVASGGIKVVGESSFLIVSPDWDNGAGLDAGAVTFGSGITGVSGLVSTTNSLVGGGDYDYVGQNGVVVLENGNYVVLSFSWGSSVRNNVGAVTFGSGRTGVTGTVSHLNSLVGTNAFDLVGAAVTVLSNSNYVVSSMQWDNGAAVDAGAVTFGSGTIGVSGAISAVNSLVGSTSNDRLGSVRALTNGNYVVVSPEWDNGAAINAGAVTFGSGTAGISGEITPTQSLVGATEGCAVGSYGVTALSNGNYVVNSRDWRDGGLISLGAVTFGSGASGISGEVSSANSLVGSRAFDRVGWNGVRALPNGNYLVKSPYWDNGAVSDAGAVTFGSGTAGVSGAVSPLNSLVGERTNDLNMSVEVTPLSNGNYVVSSPFWDNGALTDAGAATFGSGATGVTGVVSPANSLVGSSAVDGVGSVRALRNGNYVVSSPGWDNGAVEDVGAVTFGSGSTGVVGEVVPSNSLVGASANDLAGSGDVTPLSNGNYVVNSPFWSNGVGRGAGAVTFGSGDTGVFGTISSTNSLVGSGRGSGVGLGGVTALSNGNYVVASRSWTIGPARAVGAVTFGSGSAGVSGVVSSANSLIGSTEDDQVGSSGVVALADGNYLVASPFWDNGPVLNAGAVTFGSGSSGVFGVVSSFNSLVGASDSDNLGRLEVNVLPDGYYVVRADGWDDGAVMNVGAIALGLPNGSVVGPITTTHSVLGSVVDQGFTQVFQYDALRNQLIVGQPAGNRVVLHRPGLETAIRIVGDEPDPSVAGQEVLFTAIMDAAVGAPVDGRVIFSASNGERCEDTSSTLVSPTAIEFSCSIALMAAGSSEVVAEYIGSVMYAYSRSAPERHTATAEIPMIKDGFESP